MLDESQKAWESAGVQVNIACSNRFSSLVDEDVYMGGELNIDVVRQEACEVQRVRFARKLKIATWNFAGLCSEREQKEISEVLNRVKVDIVAGQETWERKDKVVNVDGYKWFGKPRTDQNSRRGEGGVGFLVRECVAEEVEFIRDVRYKESVWMKVRGGRGKEALYLCCVYMPTEGSAAAVIEDGYERLKEDVLEYQQKGRVVLLGDFNARVGKSTDVDDVIGIFGEDTCNRSGNKLISFLNELELVICYSCTMAARGLRGMCEWRRYIDHEGGARVGL